MDNVFHILEIEPTSDKKEIKKAYARLVKRYHPEEYPEEWKRLHDAYETALKIADRGKGVLPVTIEPQMIEPRMIEPQIEAGKAKDKQKTYDKKPPVLEKKLFVKDKPDKHEKKKTPALEKKLSVKDKQKTHDKKQPALEKKLSVKDKPETPRDKDEEEINLMFQDISKRLREEERQEEETRKRDLALLREEQKQMAFKERPRPNRPNKVKTFMQAVSWIVIVALCLTGIYLRMTESSRRAQQNAQQDYDMQVFIENQQKYKERNEQIKNEIAAEIAAEMGIAEIETVEIGDTKEKMISTYGEPDIIQEYSENPKYEEAVYHLEFADLKIVLNQDIVFFISYEAVEEE